MNESVSKKRPNTGSKALEFTGLNGERKGVIQSEVVPCFYI